MRDRQARASTSLTAGALIAALLLSSPAHAIAIRSDVDVSNYNAIAQLPQFQSAAYLRFFNVTNNGNGTLSIGEGTCGGTLISPTKVLTAAHCFVDAKTGVAKPYTQGLVGFDTTLPSYNQSSTASNFTSVVSPLYTTGATAGQPANDIAILTLNTPVTNVTPAQLFIGNTLGAMAAMVGYGGQNTGTALGGIPGATNRLGAYNTIDTFNTNVIQFDFDGPDLMSSTLGSATPLPLEGSVVQGDSGSALFASIDGTWVVTGDLNGGSNPTGRANNLYGEVNYYAPVSNASNFAFIQANAPDAVFDMRTVVNGVPMLAPVSDVVLAQNLVKFGSIVDPSDTLDLAPEVAVPEPASLLLLALGFGGAALARSRRWDREV